jgi:hypothetical protein
MFHPLGDTWCTSCFGRLDLGNCCWVIQQKKCLSTCSPIMRSSKPLFFYSSNNCTFPIITCGLLNNKFIKYCLCDLRTGYNVRKLLELQIVTCHSYSCTFFPFLIKLYNISCWMLKSMFIDENQRPKETSIIYIMMIYKCR